MELFKIFGTIALKGKDQFNNDLDDSSGKAEKFAGKLGNGLATAAKLGAAAVGAAATAIGALTKKALDNYAEYEQLVGGVETLFKDSADVVMQYANNAYKTAGLSANDYMETVTSFSASLLQSLGGDTEAAAEQANLAITDMSDNANKMGTDMASIQNAYQGFAKQNYTMLDNLKLGYGGTKEEMQRLIDDANELNAAQGKLTDYSIDSYADIVSAIHDVQTEIGITGTTAKEAATTIQGSVNAMKSSWTNLVTGLADDNADFDTLMNNFVDSAVTVGENIIPRIQTTIQGIAQLVSAASETIVPLIVDTLMTNLPSLLSAGVDLLLAIINGILDNLDTLIDCVLQLTDTIVDKLIENLPKLVDGGIRLTLGLAEGLIQALPDLLAKTPQIIRGIVSSLVSNIPSIFKVGVDIVKGIWNGITSMGDWLWENVKGFFGGIVDGVKDILGIHSPSKVFAGIGGFMAEGLGEGFSEEFASVKNNIEGSMNFNASAVAVSPTNTLQGYVGGAGASQNEGLLQALAKIYDAIVVQSDKLDNLGIYLDSGLLVGGLESKMDNALGKRYTNSKRLVMG